jgi:hypothetical protein
MPLSNYGKLCIASIEFEKASPSLPLHIYLIAKQNRNPRSTLLFIFWLRGSNYW